MSAPEEPRDARDLGPADRTPAATPAAADRAPGSRAGGRGRIIPKFITRVMP